MDYFDGNVGNGLVIAIFLVAFCCQEAFPAVLEKCCRKV